MGPRENKEVSVCVLDESHVFLRTAAPKKRAHFESEVGNKCSEDRAPTQFLVIPSFTEGVDPESYSGKFYKGRGRALLIKGAASAEECLPLGGGGVCLGGGESLLMTCKGPEASGHHAPLGMSELSRKLR